MVVVVGGLEQFSVSPRPLGFGFGTKGLGPGLDNTFRLLPRRPPLSWVEFIDVISTTLKAYMGVFPVLLILGLREYSWNYYTTFAGVLPQKWYSASGSTPKQTKIVHGE